jgi:hypothetical protein
MPPVTQLRGTQIADGTIKSEDIDDSLEFDLTKVRATSEDSNPNFLNSKIVAGTNITVSVIGSSGSDQTLRISSTASGGGGGTPATTVVSATSYGQSPVVGTGTDYARVDHSHGSPALGTSASTACAGNDARLTDSRAPTGAASGDLGGTYPSPTVTQARGLRETSGPTTLALGAVEDGQVLRRSGSTIVGAWLALALVVSQNDAAIDLEGLAVLYPSIVTSGGTVV